MINLNSIYTNFLELVGFRNENGIVLTPVLNASDSGLFVNDLGVKLNGIDKSIFIKPDLTKDTTISNYLARVYESETKALINDFILKTKMYFNQKELEKYFSLVSKNTLKTKQKKGEFVGYKITTKADTYNSLSTVLFLDLQLPEPQDLTLYIYDINKKDAVTTFKIEYTSEFDKERFEIDFQITQPNSTYIIGFKENELTANNQFYINELKELKYIELIQIESIRTAKNISEQEFWELTQCFFDLQIKTERDYTPLILENRMLFASALQHKIAIKILDDCIATDNFNQVTESNRTKWLGMQSKLKNELMGYKFQTADQKTGYSRGILETLVSDFKNLDGVYKNKFSLYS